MAGSRRDLARHLVRARGLVLRNEEDDSDDAWAEFLSSACPSAGHLGLFSEGRINDDGSRRDAEFDDDSSDMRQLWQSVDTWVRRSQGAVGNMPNTPANTPGALQRCLSQPKPCFVTFSRLPSIRSILRRGQTLVLVFPVSNTTARAAPPTFYPPPAGSPCPLLICTLLSSPALTIPTSRSQHTPNTLTPSPPALLSPLAVSRGTT